MSDNLTVKMQYNADSVCVYEIGESGTKYELVRWSKDEVEKNPDLPQNIEAIREIVEKDPKILVQKLYGTVYNWHKKKGQKKLE